LSIKTRASLNENHGAKTNRHQLAHDRLIYASDAGASFREEGLGSQGFMILIFLYRGTYSNVSTFLFFVHHSNYISFDSKIWFPVLKSTADL